MSYTKNKAKFDAWIQTDKGQAVEAEVLRRINLLRDRGFTFYSIKAIYESMRFDFNLRLGPKDEGGYKMTDTHAAFLVRKIIADHPELQPFFRLKSQKRTLHEAISDHFKSNPPQMRMRLEDGNVTRL